VGKSVVATALCRIFSDRGVKVAPFKAQNMSNNSGVTAEGLEMGRAQIVQAEAARVAPRVDMNPVLLKPTSDTGSQVVLMGKVFRDTSARDYHGWKVQLEAEARRGLDRLRTAHELVVMEGAGSCAEVNLMAHDLVNLPMASYAGAPVVLVADIHRGGVFAQLVGTLACLPEADRDRIAGFIINRFRGDIHLFEDGRRWIEERTGKPVFGVLPWYTGFRIEAEDSVEIEAPRAVAPERMTPPAVAVIRLPHISNFTDFEPLSRVKGLSVHFFEQVQDLSGCAAVILPGSKCTRADLAWLSETGWARALRAYADAGGHVLGICGGYQMLGTRVHDPDGIEGPKGSSPALSLLPVETTLTAPKTTTRTRFSWDGLGGAGYEIHMGRSPRQGARALFRIHEKNGRPQNDEDGCISDDGRIMGTYVHGLFDAPEITNRWLGGIGAGRVRADGEQGLLARDGDYDRLAAHFETYVDVAAIGRLVGMEWH
jgi:adenosylcobyric acid synthase